jgi:hypothetical protein
MIFNKGSRLSNVKFYIDKTELEIVRHYKYLGIMLSLNGSFTQALPDLTRRGQKAFLKLKNILYNIPCSAPNVMHIFDHTVKPVLLYASEIVGLLNNNKNVSVYSNNDSHFISNLYSRNPLEKLNINLNKCGKLRIYRKFNFIFRYETYISDIRNISHRNILTRFRTSNHKLHIETDRYIRPNTPVENRICSNCNSKSVEDELHFLMYFPRFENHRRELYSNILNYNAAVLSAEDKFVWILSNEDPSCVRELAKFIHSCFQIAP